MFDIKDPKSLTHACEWYQHLKQHEFDERGNKFPVFLAANKCDLLKQGDQLPDLDKICNERGMHSWYMTSAITSDGISEMMDVISEMAIQEATRVDDTPQEEHKDVVELNNKPKN